MPTRGNRDERVRRLSASLGLQLGESLFPIMERALPVIEAVSPVQAEILRSYFGIGTEPMSLNEIVVARGTTRTSVRRRIEKAERILVDIRRTMLWERTAPGEYGRWPPNAYITLERGLSIGMSPVAAWHVVNALEYELGHIATMDEFCEICEWYLKTTRRIGTLGLAGIKAMLAKAGKKLAD